MMSPNLSYPLLTLYIELSHVTINFDQLQRVILASINQMLWKKFDLIKSFKWTILKFKIYSGLTGIPN